MGVNRLFERGLGLAPDRACLVEDGLWRSYRAVDDRRQAIAAALLAEGAAGAKCAVYSPNSVVAFEGMLGIYRAGGVFVPLNSKNHVSENILVIDNCDVAILLYDSRLADAVAEIRQACPSVRRYVCLDAHRPDDPFLDDWIADRANPAPDAPPPDRIVSIYSTGGTTGRPKGVMFTPLTWEIMAANLFAALPPPAAPVYLVVSPLTHAAGTIGLLMMAAGATVVVHERFDAEAIITAIEQQRVTHLYLPPTAIYMLLDHPGARGRDYASLRAFIYTSAPMSVARLKEAITVFGPVMVQFWGQTEAPIFCTCLMPDQHDTAGDDRRLSSCGQPMLLTEVEVMADDGRLLPRGERGELVVRGNLVMAGYYADPEATAAASAHGWHHTGDVGYKDDDGYVYIVDRKKDMIISGGFNVYPNEVEQVVSRHPAIQDCAVIGVPDEKWGEAVMAVVELKRGADLVPDDLIAQAKAALGSIKTPKRVEIWDSLPRTSVGKIDKKTIRARFWAGHVRTI